MIDWSATTIFSYVASTLWPWSLKLEILEAWWAVLFCLLLTSVTWCCPLYITSNVSQVDRTWAFLCGILDCPWQLATKLLHDILEMCAPFVNEVSSFLTRLWLGHHSTPVSDDSKASLLAGVSETQPILMDNQYTQYHIIDHPSRSALELFGHIKKLKSYRSCQRIRWPR